MSALSTTGGMTLRGLAISPPLALAPMVGLSHSALRTLVLEEGGTGLLFTEMLAARKLPQESDRTSPYLIRGTEERPLFYQLFLTENEDIAPAVDDCMNSRPRGSISILAARPRNCGDMAPGFS